MPKIIENLPYFTEPTYENVGRETVQVKPYQVVVWVSLTVAELLEWVPAIPRFPAILDPGNNHNFSLQEVHLLHWARLALQDLQPLGAIMERGRRVRCYAANVWLHRNVPGMRSVSEGTEPVRLALPEGIPIFPPPAGTEPPSPRLPLLGLRALTDNKLDVTIRGANAWSQCAPPDVASRMAAALETSCGTRLPRFARIRQLNFRSRTPWPV